MSFREFAERIKEIAAHCHDKYHSITVELTTHSSGRQQLEYRAYVNGAIYEATTPEAVVALAEQGEQITQTNVAPQLAQLGI